MRTKLNDCFVTLRIPSEMRSNLETMAVANECSISSVIRYAVSNLQSDE
jgi:Arc/MetJ-type ribon-helix-helix transcriptional regulator